MLFAAPAGHRRGQDAAAGMRQVTPVPASPQ
jgi:hypothetical protein